MSLIPVISSVYTQTARLYSSIRR